MCVYGVWMPIYSFYIFFLVFIYFFLGVHMHKWAVLNMGNMENKYMGKILDGVEVIILRG